MNVTKNFEKNFLCTQAPVPKLNHKRSQTTLIRIHSWLNVLIVDRLFCLVTLNCLEEENLRYQVCMLDDYVLWLREFLSFSTLLVCVFSDCIRNPGFNMFDLNRDLTPFVFHIHSIRFAPFVVFANLT